MAEEYGALKFNPNFFNFGTPTQTGAQIRPEVQSAINAANTRSAVPNAPVYPVDMSNLGMSKFEQSSFNVPPPTYQMNTFTGTGTSVPLNTRPAPSISQPKPQVTRQARQPNIRPLQSAPKTNKFNIPDITESQLASELGGIDNGVIKNSYQPLVPEAPIVREFTPQNRVSALQSMQQDTISRSKNMQPVIDYLKGSLARWGKDAQGKDVYIHGERNIDPNMIKSMTDQELHDVIQGYYRGGYPATNTANINLPNNPYFDIGDTHVYNAFTQEQDRRKLDKLAEKMNDIYAAKGIRRADLEMLEPDHQKQVLANAALGVTPMAWEETKAKLAGTKAKTDKDVAEGKYHGALTTDILEMLPYKKEGSKATTAKERASAGKTGAETNKENLEIEKQKIVLDIIKKFKEGKALSEGERVLAGIDAKHKPSNQHTNETTLQNIMAAPDMAALSAYGHLADNPDYLAAIKARKIELQNPKHTKR